MYSPVLTTTTVVTSGGRIPIIVGTNEVTRYVIVKLTTRRAGVAGRGYYPYQAGYLYNDTIVRENIPGERCPYTIYR